MIIKKILSIAILLISLSGLSQTVLVSFSDAKAEIIPKLHDIIDTISAKWDGNSYCTSFSNDLLMVNSNRGYKLFSPTPPGLPVPAYQNAVYDAVDSTLTAFDSLGMTTVGVKILYPTLVDSFKNSQHYLDFYQNTVNIIKSKGFKVLLSCQSTFVDTTYGEPYLVQDILNHYYNPDGDTLTDDTLNNTRFKQEKLQMLQTIIDSLAPEYLLLDNEPMTQYENLLHLIDYSIDSLVSMINYFETNLIKGSTQLSAGAGTWEDLDYFAQIAQTNVDIIDIHLYPINGHLFYNRVFQIDSIADLYNKKLIIGEAWCYKVTNTELAGGVTNNMIFARDRFDYWEDVDTLFIKSMVDLSQQSKIEIVSFFWPTLLFGQLTYNNYYDSLYTNGYYSQITQEGQQAGYVNMISNNPDVLGLFLKNKIYGICIPTVIDEQIFANNNSEVIIYPNPANIIVNVDYNKEFVIEIYNLLGQKLIVSEKHKTNISQLSAGTYVILIKDENNMFIKTSKLIINK